MEQVNATALVSVRASRLSLTVLASDGKLYFVKLRASGGCMGSKALAYKIIKHCGVQTVEPTVVTFSEDFVRQARAQHKLEDSSSIPAGSHFGSQYPADPQSTPIFDFFPQNLAGRIENIEDLAKMRTLDAWIANPTPGQAIFVGQKNKGYKAHMVGFGGSFSFRPHSPQRSWNWRLAPLRAAATWLTAADTVDVVRRITKRDLKALAADIPADWWTGSPTSTTEIIDALVARTSSLGKRLTNARRDEFDSPVRKAVQVERAFSAAACRYAG